MILLSVAALCVTLIGTSCSTNARIDDMNARIGDMNTALNARIDDVNANVNARIDELRHEVNARIDELGEDVRELRAIVIDALQAEPPAVD